MRIFRWCFLYALCLFGLSSCFVETEPSIEEKYGLIDYANIKDWSALWQMSQAGTIEFCIRNAASNSEKRRVESAAVYSVNNWVSLLNQSPPSSGYPAWNRSSVSTTFGCSSRSYKIDMFSGRSNCPYYEKRINLDHQFSNNELAHEFGHSMGLADTYSYQGGGALPYQPSSMMQDARTFTSDDKAGIWSLWSFINTGQVRCGPGYVSGRDYNGWGDALCQPGQGSSQGGDTTTTSSCQYRCRDQGECYEGQWVCRSGCWVQESCGGNGTSNCQYQCNSEGECYEGQWVCRSGCWVQESCGGSGTSSCQYRCADYRYSEGECRGNWRCSGGCLSYGC